MIPGEYACFYRDGVGIERLCLYVCGKTVSDRTVVIRTWNVCWKRDSCFRVDVCQKCTLPQRSTIMS